MDQNELALIGVISLLPEDRQKVVKEKSAEMVKAVSDILAAIPDKQNKLIAFGAFGASLERMYKEIERG